MSDDNLYPQLFHDRRSMIFVDGENLAIRYGEMFSKNTKDLIPQPQPQPPGVWYEPDVAVWSQRLWPNRSIATVVRQHYYTSVRGDEPRRDEIARWLKGRGFESPRVFSRDRNGRSKQVDISLTTEMLTHAHRKHYEVAILVAGDADYVPLVRAVKAEGARVHVWALSSGLSPKLEMEADRFVSLDGYF